MVEVQSQATNATLSWTKPSDAGQPGITAYQITADDGMVTPIVYTSSDNLTEQTITGLLPGREYQFTVRAVSSSGDAMALSNASLPVFANTSTTGQLECACLICFNYIISLSGIGNLSLFLRILVAIQPYIDNAWVSYHKINYSVLFSSGGNF